MSSEVVGTLMIILLVSLMVGMLFVASQPVIFGSREAVKEREAYFSMVELREKIDQVRFGAEPNSTARIHLSGVSVAMRNEPIIAINGTSYRVSSIVFYGENWELVMENGAILEIRDGRKILVFSPPIYLNGETLTLPLISFNGSVSTGGKGTVSVFLSLQNVSLLKTGAARVDLTSNNAEVWYDFFRELGVNSMISGNTVSFTVRDSYIVLYEVRVE